MMLDQVERDAVANRVPDQPDRFVVKGGVWQYYTAEVPRDP